MLGPSQPQPGTVPGIPLPERRTHQALRGPKLRTLRSGSQTFVPMDTDAGFPGPGGTRGCEEPRALRPLSAQQTYIGSILVSVNPYRMFGIYGLEQVHQYSGRALGENPP